MTTFPLIVPQGLDLKHLLQTAVEHANDVILISEAEPVHRPGPRVIYVNPAFTRMTGYAPEEIIGQSPRILQGPKTDPATRDYLRTCLKTWQPARVELLNYRKDGTEFWVELNIRPIADSTGWYTHWIAIQRDITARKVAELERQRLFRSLASDLTDAELAQRLKRLALVAEKTSNGVVILDTAGRVEWINEGFTRLSGYVLDEVVGRKPIGFLLGPKAEPKTLESIHAAFVDQRPFTGEVYCYGKGGRNYWIHLSITPIFGDDGTTLEGFIAVELDITQRKETESELSRLYAQTRQLMVSISSILIALDSQNRIVTWNSAAQEAFGGDAAERIGRYVFEVSANWDWSRILPAIIECKNSDKPMRLEDLPYTRRNGSKGYLGITINPFRDIAASTGETEARGVLLLAADVTERRNADATMERLAAIVDSSDDAVIGKDLNGIVSSWNDGAARLYGYTAEEMLGQSVFRLIPPGYEDEMAKIIQSVVDGKRPSHYETTRRTRDGRLVYVSKTVSPIKDKDGMIIGVSAVDRDVTERRRAEAEIVALSKELEHRNADLVAARDHALDAARLKSEFLANMSHEIRTPMNGVIGMLEVLSMMGLTEEQTGYARIAKQSADALLTVLNDILDVSKIEAGKMTIETVAFSLRSVLEDVVTLYAPKAHAKGLEIACLLPPFVSMSHSECLMGDPSRLRQVLTNLVGNAIKFTEAGGEVSVSASVAQETEREARWRICVQDTGIGIPADRQGAIFESFTQADGSTTRKYGGTGLGLTISRQLVGLMGGEIGVSSAPGEGSEFWVEIAWPKQAGRPPLSRDEERLSGKRVLVAARSAATRRSLCEPLSAWGCLVEEVRTEREFAASCRSFAPQAVLMDQDLHAVWEPSLPSFGDAVLILLTTCLDTGSVPSDHEKTVLVKPVRQADLYRALGQISGQGASEPVHPARTSSPETAGVALRQGQVLIAEDNPVNLRVILSILERCGIPEEQTVTVVNGIEALTALERGPFDLILLDVQMPLMDGLEVVRTIRAREVDEGRARLPVIAVTAHALESDVARSLEAGMDDHVNKPISVDRIAAVLDKWLPACPPVPDDSSSGGCDALLEFPALDERFLQETYPGASQAVAVASDFLSFTPRLLERCALMVELDDGPGLQHWAGALRDACLAVGAPRLAMLCGGLDEAGRRDAAGAAGAVIAQAREAWDTTATALEAYEALQMQAA